MIICLGDGILARTGQLLVETGARPGHAAVVANPMLAQHAETLAQSLVAEGFEPLICTVPEGRQRKRRSPLWPISTRQFLAARLDRNSCVLALGGGVVGDMAGFAAATYLHGVPLCNCQPRCWRWSMPRSAAERA